MCSDALYNHRVMLMLCRTGLSAKIDKLEAELAAITPLLAAAQKSCKACEDQRVSEQSSCKRLQKEYDQVCTSRYVLCVYCKPCNVLLSSLSSPCSARVILD